MLSEKFWLYGQIAFLCPHTVISVSLHKSILLYRDIFIFQDSSMFALIIQQYKNPQIFQMV